MDLVSEVGLLHRSNNTMEQLISAMLVQILTFIDYLNIYMYVFINIKITNLNPIKNEIDLDNYIYFF